MRPYEVEIFDREFNFRGNALIPAEEFQYKEDALDPEKNTFNMEHRFYVSKGDYIRITRGNEKYIGIASEVERGEVADTITYSQLLTLFDLGIRVTTSAISQTTIEAYIIQCLTQMFIQSGDSTQNIPGIVINGTGSETVGSLDYANQTEEEVIINLLDDLIYPAFEIYSIFTDVYLDFQNKIFSVTVGKNLADAVTIEADLPNIFEKSFTIRKTNKEINKVEVYDVDHDEKITFYLHTDGSYDSEDIPATRIYPVVNDVIAIHGDTLARQIVDARFQNAIDVLETYGGDDFAVLSDTQFLQLQEAVNLLGPLFDWNQNRGDFTLPDSAYIQQGGIDYPYETSSGEKYGPHDWYYTATPWTEETGKDYSGGVYYGPPGIGWTFRAYQNYIGQTYQVAYPAPANYGSGYNLLIDDGTLLGEGKVHAAFIKKYEYDDKVYSHSGFFYYHYYETCATPMTASMAKTAFNQFKNGSRRHATLGNYATMVETIRQNILTTAAQGEADKAFQKNKYSNLIELVSATDDSLVNSAALSMGQAVNVIHDGVDYDTILTGKEIGEGKTKLIFGMIRLELTKYLKGRY